MATYTENSDTYASKGVGNAGLALGIIGTSLASGILGGNGLGGIFNGNGNRVACAANDAMTLAMAQKDAEIAQLKADKATDAKLVEVYKDLRALDGMNADACVTRPDEGGRETTEGLMRQACACTEGAVYFHVKPDALAWAKPAWENTGGTWSTFIFNVGQEEPGPTVPHTFSAYIYGWNAKRKHWFCGERNKPDVWEFRDTEKAPRSLLFAGEAIRNSTVPGKTVFDPAAANGDTLLAAEMACRRAVCVERDPDACARIIACWEAFTHRQAELTPSGGARTKRN